ncbi:hypothetical protein Tco_0754254 [Tanacetum coccineum]
MEDKAWAQAMGDSKTVHYELQAYRAHTRIQDLRISLQETLTWTLKMAPRKGTRTRTPTATATVTASTSMTNAAIMTLIA